ncbi:MAG: DUF1640 domain-containing protein [Candidatus Dadabacteria bacterium]|nr:MAG: DUF1640 domain-containing protein [Candidatus Dadabacteria bacterium]
MGIPLDTLEIYERPRRRNMDEELAKELSEIFRESVHYIVERQGEVLATKEDLTRAKVEIIKWVAGMLVAQAAVVAAMVKLL